MGSPWPYGKVAKANDLETRESDWVKKIIWRIKFAVLSADKTIIFVFDFLINEETRYLLKPTPLSKILVKYK